MSSQQNPAQEPADVHRKKRGQGKQYSIVETYPNDEEYVAKFEKNKW
jgi:hypothetical protein